MTVLGITGGILAITWGMLVFKCSKSWRFLQINTVSRIAPQKSITVSIRMILVVNWHRLDEREGNISCYKAIFVCVVWHVVPFCWKHILCKPGSTIAVDNHATITLRESSDSLAIVVFKGISSNHNTGPNSAPLWVLFSFHWKALHLTERKIVSLALEPIVENWTQLSYRLSWYRFVRHTYNWLHKSRIRHVVPGIVFMLVNSFFYGIVVKFC